MKLVKFMVITTFMFAIVYGIANSSKVAGYISTIERRNSTDVLQKAVTAYAKEHNIQPIDPRIDKVWHLIPGLNGYIVDTPKTMAWIDKKKLDSPAQIIYFWKETEPTKNIKELGAHPIYRGNPNKPSVSLMINVAWGTEYINTILKILAEEDVKVTFFLDGSWLNNNKEMAMKMVLSGHEIGNHAYSHPQMSRLTNDRIKQEILKTETLIKEITNNNSALFAPPSGDFDERVVAIADELNIKTVLWTLDTVDWKKPSKETIIKRIVPNIKNGYLVLMHPTKPTSEALPELIREIKKKGYIITTASETLSTKRVP